MTTHKRLIQCKAKGLCPNCGDKTDGGHTFCSKCRQKARDKYHKAAYPDGIKRCLDCGKVIPTSNKRTPNRCPECRHKYNNEWARNYYAANPKKRERVKKYYRERYHKNKQKLHTKERNNRIKRLYGISDNEFLTLYNRQSGKCAICGHPISSRGKDIAHIDHDHSTGAIRGLLCSKCNMGLGLFDENPEMLNRAIQYLSPY